MAAATLLPPFRPRAIMYGTGVVMISSLLSTNSAGNGLAHLGEVGEMDDTVDLIFFKHRIDRVLVSDFYLLKPGFRVDRRAKARFQIVRDDHVPPRVDKLINGVGAYVSGLAQD